MGTAKAVLLLSIAFATLTVLYIGSQQAAEPPSPVRNIIIMIGDGMGYNHVEAASLYRFGETGGQVYCSFPVQFGMSTHSYDGTKYDPDKAWTDFNFVRSFPTDSAASATALSTGVKTSYKTVGRQYYGGVIENLMERAEKYSKATGVVSSVPFAHATPACYVAHNISRYSYEDIAREMIKQSRLEVIMGTGHPLYDDDGGLLNEPMHYEMVGGKQVWERLLAGMIGSDADGDLESDPWTLVQTREEFLALTSGETPKRVIGIPQVHTTLQLRRRGVDLPSDRSNVTVIDTTPFETPYNKGVPTLAEMSLAALSVLSRSPSGGDHGFVVMIEGGAIDWAAHANRSARFIEEQIDFDKAVEAVIEWVDQNSNWDETLLIVTADHETGYLLGPDSNPEWTPLLNNGKGKLPGLQWNSKGHTNSLVPLYAKGRAAALLEQYADETDPVRGRYVDNTEIAKLIFELIEASGHK